jgi:hypothetical protein
VCSIGCLAKLDEWLAVLKAFLCSLNRVAKFLPVCPTYTFPQSSQTQLVVFDLDVPSFIITLFNS